MNRVNHRDFMLISLRAGWIALLATICCGVALPPEPAAAAGFGTVIRKMGKLADDVPLRRVDDVAEQLGKSRAGRDLLQKTGQKVDDAASYRRALNRAVRETLEEAGDPALLRHVNQLDDAGKEAVLILARGSRTVRDGIPDVAARARFLREGGAETVAALGRYGDLMPDANRFYSAVRAGRIQSPAGLRAVGMEDFGRFFRQMGDRGHHFWDKSVRPHWGKWLAGGALAAVLLAPEEYLDEVGELTKEGFAKVGRFGTKTLADALAGTIEGVGEGVKEGIEEITTKTWNTYFRDGWGIAALAVILSFVAVVVFWTRQRIKRWLNRLGIFGPATTHAGSENRPPQSVSSNHTESTP